MGAGDFTGPATDTVVTAAPRVQAGAKSTRTDLTVIIGAQAGAKSTRTDVTAARPTVGAKVWSGGSTALAVTQTPHDDGVIDLAGALLWAADIAAAASSTALIFADVRNYVAHVKGVGAAIRRNGGDHVQAGLADPDSNGWIGRVMDIHRLGTIHGDEGVEGFCLAGVDYVAWTYDPWLENTTPSRALLGIT